jgi:hypothetical protein
MMEEAGGKVAIVLLLAVLLGLGIGWVDSRPTWDDTGITVGAILVLSAILGGVLNKRPWLVALALAGPMVVLAFMLTGNGGVVIAFMPALVGAYAGALVARLF